MTGKLPVLTGRFVVLVGGKLEVYASTDLIPETFDNLIEFVPDYPPDPHTPDQHRVIERFNDVLRDLMLRETR